MEEMLKGLMLRSGNDAAVAIAEHIGGSVENFAAMMNARAEELGADVRATDQYGRGVLMEARSVEDEGAGLQFCVWAYNAQPGITIDYVDGNSEETPLLPAAGESSASGSEGSSNAGSAASDASSAQVKSYVLNTNTKKFHVPGCSSVKKMKDANRQDVESTRSDLLAQGYEPCQKCNP